MAVTPDIFLSHSSKDDKFVDRIYHALTDAGISVWCDHHFLQPGHDWNGEIQKALPRCKGAILALSPNSAISQEVTVEWRTIMKLGKRLYIALIEDVPDEIFPYRLTIENYVNLGKNFETGMASLITAIAGRRPLTDEDPATDNAIHLSGQFPRIQLDLPLIGRDTEKQAILDSFASGNRITAILGFGGVGKTRLAAEIAVKATDFRDGVIWHHIDKLATPQKLIQQVREHLNLPPMEDDPTWAELGKRQLLIILDNAEDCVSPEAYIQRLNTLDTNGGTRVLMTSRVLWKKLKAERVDLVAPDHQSAIEILQAMIEREKPDFPLDDHEAEIVNGARRHPRLMEYAVGWANSFPADYVIEMLTTLKGDDPEEALEDIVQKTISQMVEQQGDDTAVQALRRLAVFRGGFTLDAARAVLNEDQLSAIGVLIRWSLLRVEDERYTEIDPLIVDVVGDDESVKQAHFDYYKELAEVHDDRQDYAGLAVESANLETAFERMILQGNYELAYWLYNSCDAFFANRGRFDQRFDWISRVGDHLGEPMQDNSLAGAVQMSLGIVFKDKPIGRHDDNLRHAIQAYETALLYFTPESAPRNFAKAENNLGNAYLNLAAIEDHKRNLHRAVHAYKVALHYRTSDKVPLAFARTQHNLGIAYRKLAAIENHEQNLRHAMQAFETALEHRSPEIAPLDFAQSQIGLGNVYRKLAAIEDHERNLQRAIQAYEAAIKYSTPDTAPLDFAMAHHNMGIAYRKLAAVKDREKNLYRAILAHEVALQFHDPDQSPGAYAQTQHGLAIVYKELGDTQQAMDCWQKAEHYYRQTGFIDNADRVRERIDDTLMEAIRKPQVDGIRSKLRKWLRKRT